MLKILIPIFLFFLTTTNNAQEYKLYGEFQSGGLIIGQAPDVELIRLNNDTLLVNENGNFIFGFDRDESGIYYLKFKFKNGFAAIKKIVIPKRKYSVQRLDNIDPSKVNPPESELNRIAKESAIIKEAKIKLAGNSESLYQAGIKRPIAKGRITGKFGNQRILNGIKKSPHSGLDIGAPKGRKIYPMTDGVVVLTGYDFYYAGNVVMIDHGQGLISYYLHQSEILVDEGDEVNHKTVIGKVGSTGRSTGPHLHWSIQWNGKRIDPAFAINLKYLNKD